MIIKGPIIITSHGYKLTLVNLDIAPADYSVGINGDTLEGFEIRKISVHGKRLGSKMLPYTKKLIEEKFYNDEEYILDVETKVFDELYKLQEKKYKEAYQRAKKRGYKGTYADWAGEYT